MTPQLIYGCLEMINIRKHNDIAVQVNVHGGDMKFKEVRKEFVDFSEDEKKLMTERTNKLLKENQEAKARKRAKG